MGFFSWLFGGSKKEKNKGDDMSTEKKINLPAQEIPMTNSVDSQETEGTKSQPVIPPTNQNLSQPELNQLNKPNDPSTKLTSIETEIQNQLPNLQTQIPPPPLNKPEQKLSQSTIRNILNKQNEERIKLAQYILKIWDSSDDPLISINNIISINVSATPLRFGENNEVTVPLNIRQNPSSSNNQKTSSLPNKYNRKPIGFGPSTKGDIANIGLQISFDNQNSTATIKGTPSKAGDYEYHFIFLVSLDFISDKLEVHNGCLKITVNADPKTLWKEIEPTEDLYRKPHTHHYQIIRGDIILAGASRRGRSHAHSGLFRDDDFAFNFLEELGFWIVAVADGAGGSKLSRKGSQIACEVVTSQISEKIRSTGVDKIESILKNAVLSRDEELCKKFLSILPASTYYAFQKIDEEAKNTGKNVKDFSTTLNISVIKKFEDTWFVGTFAIGDGGVSAIDSNGNVFNLSEYDEGEFAGQTRFIHDGFIWNSEEQKNKRLRCCFIKDLKYVFASTDGITDPYFATINDFKNPEKWKVFIEELEKETGMSTKPKDLDKRLLEWLNFWAPTAGNHDDRTIAIFVA